MSERLLPFLLLAACGTRIAGTTDGQLPSGARAMVLWQGWDVLGAEGGRGPVRAGEFSFAVRPPTDPLALGASTLPDTLIGLVVVVDGPVEDAELRGPDGLSHVLGADPRRAVYSDRRPREDCSVAGGDCESTDYPYGRGEACVECGSGECVETPCDSFEIQVPDSVLGLGFTVPWGGEPGLVYDESGESVAYAARGPNEVEAGLTSVYVATLGEPRALVATLDEAYRIDMGSLHQGEGLLVADVEFFSGDSAVVVIGLDGIERWRIEHGVEPLVDGPYLSNNGRLVAWAERTRIVLADAHTGEELSSVRVSDDDAARVRWSSTNRGVFVFPGSGRPFTVGVTAKDWPWCDGSASLTSNRCSPEGEQWGVGVLGQVARAPEQVCEQAPYQQIERASSPPEELAGCE